MSEGALFPDELLSVVRAVPCGLLFVGPDGQIVLANAAAERIFGYPPGALSGLSVEALVPTAARADHAARRGDFGHAESGRQMGRGRIIKGLRRDGAEVTVEVGLSPPAPNGMVITSIVDVSLLASNLDGLAVVADDGRLLYVNPAASALLGVGPDGGGRFPLPTLCGETLVVELEGRDGQRLWVEALMAEIPWEGQRAVLASLRDVTERRRLEEQLHAERRTTLVGRLAGGVAHNFNNALQSIVSGVEEAAATDDPVRREALLATVLDVARESGILTRRLMELGGITFATGAQTELDGTIAELVPVLRALVGDRGTLRYRPAGERILIETEAAQLHQLLLELVTNARDAMEAFGAVEVVASPELRRAACVCGVPLPAGGAWCEVAVIDDGPGIPAAVLPRVFEPFFTTKPGGGAAGLGLAAARAALDRVGGHICVASAPGGGATFRVLLPCRRPVETTPGDPVPSGPRAASILVVDDERLIRTLVAKHLEREGHDVRMASGGPEALALMRDHPFDLMVTDVVMPEMNGFTLAWEARRAQPALRVLFVTGYSGSASLATLQTPDDDVDLLVKPFGMKELASRVQAALTR